MFSILNRSRFGLISNRVFVNLQFIAFNYSSRSRSVESASTLLVEKLDQDDAEELKAVNKVHSRRRSRVDQAIRDDLGENQVYWSRVKPVQGGQQVQIVKIDAREWRCLISMEERRTVLLRFATEDECKKKSAALQDAVYEVIVGPSFSLEDAHALISRRLDSRIPAITCTSQGIIGKYASINPKLPINTGMAVIMYTSGSTGLPKSVMIIHGNIVATSAAVMIVIRNLRTNDVYVAYLPLAHVFEFDTEILVIAGGASIGYSLALSLIDTSNKVKSIVETSNKQSIVELDFELRLASFYLFFCLKFELVFDGHLYLSEDDKRGVVAVVAGKEIDIEEILGCKALVIMEDTNVVLAVLNDVMEDRYNVLRLFFRSAVGHMKESGLSEELSQLMKFMESRLQLSYGRISLMEELCRLMSQLDWKVDFSEFSQLVLSRLAIGDLAEYCDGILSTTSSIWFLDTSIEEQQRFDNVICLISSSVDEVLSQGSLANEVIELTEVEVEFLNALKCSKLSSFSLLLPLSAQYLKEKSLSFELAMSMLEHSDEIDSSVESVTTSTCIG